MHIPGLQMLWVNRWIRKARSVRLLGFSVKVTATGLKECMKVIDGAKASVDEFAKALECQMIPDDESQKHGHVECAADTAHVEEVNIKLAESAISLAESEFMTQQSEAKNIIENNTERTPNV